MFQDHYPPLVISYLVTLGGWLAVSRALRAWPREPMAGLARPWREFGIALLGAVTALLLSPVEL